VFYRKTDSDFEQGIQRVFGERIILADEEITYLANINVVLDSVIVRDESGLILIPNMDYSLSVHGALVEIKREDLPNNTAVLVDYEYEVPKELDYDSLITGVSLRYDFRQFFALYYNYSSTDHNIHTDLSKFDSVSPLQEEKVSLYGSEFKWRWFDLDAEYEDDSSDLVPFKGWRVRGNFKLYPADSIAFNLNGSHSKIRYQEEKRDVTFNHIEASLNYRFSNLLEAEFRAGYFKEYGDDTDDRVIKFNADVTSRFREIELQLETEYMNRDEITEDRDELTIRFKFVRYFHLI
jgi:hypothetical protein